MSLDALKVLIISNSDHLPPLQVAIPLINGHLALPPQVVIPLASQ